jgi:hypothetical protein
MLCWRCGGDRSVHTRHYDDYCTESANHLTQQFKKKFTVRGVVRGASLGLCAVNVAGCGLAYVFGKREKEEQ